MTYTRSSFPSSSRFQLSNAVVAMLAGIEGVAWLYGDRGPGWIPLAVTVVAVPASVLLTTVAGSRIVDAAAVGDRPRRDDVALGLLLAATAAAVAIDAGQWLLVVPVLACAIATALNVHVLRDAARAARAELAEQLAARKVIR